jgi:hypothetical protein
MAYQSLAENDKSLTLETAKESHGEIFGEQKWK